MLNMILDLGRMMELLSVRVRVVMEVLSVYIDMQSLMRILVARYLRLTWVLLWFGCRIVLLVDTRL